MILPPILATFPPLLGLGSAHVLLPCSGVLGPAVCIIGRLPCLWAHLSWLRRWVLGLVLCCLVAPCLQVPPSVILSFLGICVVEDVQLVLSWDQCWCDMCSFWNSLLRQGTLDTSLSVPVCLWLGASPLLEPPCQCTWVLILWCPLLWSFPCFGTLRHWRSLSWL